MLPPDAVLVALLLSLSQAAPVDGTWELARIFRSGATARTRVVPIDSTVYVRLTLETHPGGWMGGRLYRSYFGRPEGSKIEAGPLRGTNRFVIGVELDNPTWQRARSAAWLVGTRLRLGTPLVPDADSLEFRRVAPDAPYAHTVLEVVTRR
jgi:hypothetical protein